MLDSVNIALIDDDISMRLIIENLLNCQNHFKVGFFFAVTTIDDYFSETRAATVDLLLLDLHLSDQTSLFEIMRIKAQYPKIKIVMLSSDLSLVQAAMRQGADDFIRKGASDQEIALRIAAICRPVARPALDLIVGVGSTIERFAARIPAILQSAVCAVLVRGETGTGKEVVAQLFKELQPKGLPFISVNCAAIAPSLLERELFGHVKGAYTGALNSAKGYLVAADNGWLFLDEVGSLSLNAQAALLRVLEVGELTPVGATAPIKVNIKIIAATHEDLEAKIIAGEFRSDLYQRLNEIEFWIPPLRQRRDEIAPLAHSFAAKMELGPYVISPEAMAILEQQDWASGNVRELRNCLRAMTERHVNQVLTPLAIPPTFFNVKNTAPSTSENKGLSISFDPSAPKPFDQLTDELLALTLRTLSSAKQKMSIRELSTRLSIPKTSLHSHIKRLVQKGLLNDREF